jgi:hypothetical protein
VLLVRRSVYYCYLNIIYSSPFIFLLLARSCDVFSSLSSFKFGNNLIYIKNRISDTNEPRNMPISIAVYLVFSPSKAN